MDSGKNEAEGKLLENNGGIQKIIIVRQQSKCKPKTPILSVVDIVLSVFVVTPLVVLSWRGLWGFMDLHARYFPILPSFLTGIIIHVLLAVTQDKLHAAIVESDKHWSLNIVSHFLRRFYTYVFLNITVLHWRGGWGLIDNLMNTQFTENNVAKKEGSHWFLIIWATCLATLITIKGLKNAIAPPFAICIDKGNYVFRFQTMFRRQTKHSPLLSILDGMFSVGVIGNLVVATWRGFWMLTDILLLPEDYSWSAWMSAIAGILLVGLVFRMQHCMKELCTKYSSGISKIIIADCYIILSCIAIILYWRGVWYLTCIYILPNNVELSCIFCHLIGFMSLVVLGCSNSMLVRGVYIDGKEEKGECIVFPCQYLRIILEEEDTNDVEEIESSDLSEVKMIENKNNNIITM